MKKYVVGIVATALLLSAAFTVVIPSTTTASGASELLYGKISPQPLTVKVSAQQVHVGESIWLTVSGGVEPYVLITVENKIQVVSRGKNTYQITGLTAGDSGLTIGDSKNNKVTKVITVLPRR